MTEMYRHKQELLTFRLGPWPWGGQSYNWPMRKIPFNMGELLDFLEEQLSNSHVYIRGAEFTLVNVSSKFSNQSYGHMPNVPNLKTYGPVTFTFSLRRNTKAYRVRTSHRMSQHTEIWGSTGPWDFISVTVPLNMAIRAKLNNSLMLHLEHLYKVVGAFTKSVALNLRRSQDGTVTSSVVYRNIPALMRRFPRKFWPYNIEMWKYPYLMHIPQDEEFLQYYVTTLAGKVKLDKSPEFKKYADETLHKSIVDLMQKKHTQRLVTYLEELALTNLQTWLLSSKHNFSGPTVANKIIEDIHRGRFV